MTDQNFTFNLIHEPWLPVRRRSGFVQSIQPWRITEGLDDDPCIAFAWPRPDFNGAAHELLIGLLATTAAPEDDDAWDERWLNPPTPDVLEQRFASVAHAFDLHGAGPRFLQDIDPLEDAGDKPIGALLIDTPGAQTLRNNADLFVKRGGVPVLSRAATAMALYTLNSYAPSGGAGHRTSLRGGGPMTTLIAAEHPSFGSTLWGRLWPSVESRDSSDDIYDDKVFPWLAATRTSNPKANGRATSADDVHPLQVYWGMPRRIRLRFDPSRGRLCGLTGAEDSFVAEAYRTRNYGVNYSEGFKHPLTPHYRQNAKAVAWLPVHPQPGGISYRSWPGLVVHSKDGLREPAAVIRHWGQEREFSGSRARFVAFGYDMDNMKARAWIEAEMPVWQLDGSTYEWLSAFIGRTTAAAGTVSRLLVRAVKSAAFDNPADAPGDNGFIAERFFRETESAFFASLDRARSLVRAHSGLDDETDEPTIDARRSWAPVMEAAAMRLFDEYAPAAGLEDRDMQRHVKARFQLALALRGRGKAGNSLFESDLGIPVPRLLGLRGGDRATGGEKETA